MGIKQRAISPSRNVLNESRTMTINKGVKSLRGIKKPTAKLPAFKGFKRG